MASRNIIKNIIIAAWLLLISLIATIKQTNAEDNELITIGAAAPVQNTLNYSGALSYSIPIKVPPGRNNIAPNLTIYHLSIEII